MPFLENNESWFYYIEDDNYIFVGPSLQFGGEPVIKTVKMEELPYKFLEVMKIFDHALVIAEEQYVNNGAIAFALQLLKVMSSDCKSGKFSDKTIQSCYDSIINFKNRIKELNDELCKKNDEIYRLHKLLADK